MSKEKLERNILGAIGQIKSAQEICEGLKNHLGASKLQHILDDLEIFTNIVIPNIPEKPNFGVSLEDIEMYKGGKTLSCIEDGDFEPNNFERDWIDSQLR